MTDKNEEIKDDEFGDDEKAEYIINEWQCKECTLIQSISNQQCEVCGATNSVITQQNTESEEDNIGDCIYYDMIMSIIEQSPTMNINENDNDFAEFMVKLESLGITSDHDKSRAISIYDMIKLQQQTQNKHNIMSEYKNRSNYNSSKVIEKIAMAEAEGLKSWMKHNQIWEKQLFLVLVQYRITEMPQDLFKIDSWYTFQDIIRQVRVARKAELKSAESQKRLDKLCTKFEKIWKKETGYRVTSIKDNDKKKIKNKLQKHKKRKHEVMKKETQSLRVWMKKNTIWQLALYEELSNAKVLKKYLQDPELMISKIDEKAFNEIVRKVRVERFTQLKDSRARLQCDKILQKFEKLWRNKTGIKKTSIKK